jgi:inosose dehydratase
MVTKFQRRHFMVGAAAASLSAGSFHTTELLGKTIKHKPLDPVNPDILFGTTSSIWGGAGEGGKKTHETPWAIKRVAELGLQGIEFYGDGIEQYRANPKELQKLMDASNVTFIGASNGEKGQSTNFIDPDQIPKTMADHISEEQLKRLANTLNELGAKTIAMGVRLSPHPHIWGPLEREKDMRWVMDHTDPKYVWMTADTGHLVLGGGDPAKIISDYFPRVSEIHLKDTYAKYRGNTQTPTQEMHKQASVYHNLGGGGVDFPAVFDVLRKKHFKGWAIFDVDGPRKGDDGYDAIGGNRELAVDDYLSHNINYLRDVLGIKLPPYST